MVRAVFAGLGGAVERIHLGACGDVAGLEVVGGCDPDAGRREWAAQSGVGDVFESAEAMLGRLKPDLVIVASPPDSHAELTRLALESGAHVLCEKPFMESVEQADSVIAAARAAGLGVWVNNQYRYMGIYRQTREYIEEGGLGRLIALQCWQQMYHPAQWESQEWRSGLRRATLFEFGTHALDLITYFFGELPETVSAHMPEVSAEWTSDVLVQATLRFPSGGLATLFLNRVSHAPERYLEMRLDGAEGSARLSLGGVARASVDWVRQKNGFQQRWGWARGGEARVEVEGRSRVLVREAKRAFQPATAELLRAMVAAIGEGRCDTAPAEHARDVLRVVFAGYAAAEGGETVRI